MHAGGIIAWGIPAWVAHDACCPSALPSSQAASSGTQRTRSRGRLLAACGLALPVIFGVSEAPAETRVADAVRGRVIAAATACGMPIFAAMGGAALLLFWADGTPANAVPGEAYRLTTSPMLPAIPLFALGGYLLAEGGASHRLTRLFTALVRMDAGRARDRDDARARVLHAADRRVGRDDSVHGRRAAAGPRRARYPESTSIGLVTVSGSIGLLFFPSLPGVSLRVLRECAVRALVHRWAAARHPAGDGRRGMGGGPGLAARRGPDAIRTAGGRGSDVGGEVGSRFASVVLGGLVAGIVTLVEAAALTVALRAGLRMRRPSNAQPDARRPAGRGGVRHAHRRLHDHPRRGARLHELSGHRRDSHALLEWSQARIESPVVFLLALNVFLSSSARLMDIYSAIVVVVPLILPMAAAYGVDPVHLAVIFLANMELGYLMPPMGENLFLSSYRFKQPLPRIYRSTLPYTAILLLAVLLITLRPLAEPVAAERVGAERPAHSVTFRASSFMKTRDCTYG